jgi:hypothetical protein
MVKKPHWNPVACGTQFNNHKSRYNVTRVGQNSELYVKIYIFNMCHWSYRSFYNIFYEFFSGKKIDIFEVTLKK